MERDSFATLLRQVIAHARATKRVFARAIGIAPSSLSHYLSPDSDSTPGIEVCLLIAKHGRVSASRVLRAAGRNTIADLLDELYGPERKTLDALASSEITLSERAHLEALRTTAPATRRALILLTQRSTVVPLPQTSANHHAHKIKHTADDDHHRRQIG